MHKYAYCYSLIFLCWLIHWGLGLFVLLLLFPNLTMKLDVAFLSDQDIFSFEKGLLIEMQESRRIQDFDNESDLFFCDYYDSFYYMCSRCNFFFFHYGGIEVLDSERYIDTNLYNFNQLRNIYKAASFIEIRMEKKENLFLKKIKNKNNYCYLFNCRNENDNINFSLIEVINKWNKNKIKSLIKVKLN